MNGNTPSIVTIVDFFNITLNTSTIIYNTTSLNIYFLAEIRGANTKTNNTFFFTRPLGSNNQSCIYNTNFQNASVTSWYPNSIKSTYSDILNLVY
jgi:hypothetical protein